jgi:hypothetical protein
VVAGLLGVPALLVPGAIAVAAASAAHLTWVSRIARDRKRPALDWGLRFVLTGSAFLIAAGAVGLGLAFDLLSGPRAALAYAVLGLGGWVSLTIVGMMLKIIPFLVWYRIYSPQAGRVPVPTLAQLGWPAAEGVAYALLTAGVAALAAALAVGDARLIAAAGVILAAGRSASPRRWRVATTAPSGRRPAAPAGRPRHEYLPPRAVAGSSDAPTASRCSGRSAACSIPSSACRWSSSAWSTASRSSTAPSTSR